MSGLLWGHRVYNWAGLIDLKERFQVVDGLKDDDTMIEDYRLLGTMNLSKKHKSQNGLDDSNNWFSCFIYNSSGSDQTINQTSRSSLNGTSAKSVGTSTECGSPSEAEVAGPEEMFPRGTNSAADGTGVNGSDSKNDGQNLDDGSRRGDKDEDRKKNENTKSTAAQSMEKDSLKNIKNDIKTHKEGSKSKFGKTLMKVWSKGYSTKKSLSIESFEDEHTVKDSKNGGLTKPVVHESSLSLVSSESKKIVNAESPAPAAISPADTQRGRSNKVEAGTSLTSPPLAEGEGSWLDGVFFNNIWYVVRF